jgi:hypothetical protein
MSRAYISSYTFVIFGGKSLILAHNYTQEIPEDKIVAYLMLNELD